MVQENKTAIHFIFNTTKDSTPFYFPGSAFLLASGLLAVSLLITYLVLQKNK